MPSRSTIGPTRSQRAQPLKVSEPKVRGPTPAQIEAAALRAEAAATWSAATGLPADTWIGRLDPFVEPVVDAVRDALQAGAGIDVRGIWAVVTGVDGKRWVIAADVLSDAARGSTPWR
jgi:hypothetical protein